MQLCRYKRCTINAQVKVGGKGGTRIDYIPFKDLSIRETI